MTRRCTASRPTNSARRTRRSRPPRGTRIRAAIPARIRALVGWFVGRRAGCVRGPGLRCRRLQRRDQVRDVCRSDAGRRIPAGRRVVARHATPRVVARGDVVESRRVGGRVLGDLVEPRREEPERAVGVVRERVDRGPLRGRGARAVDDRPTGAAASAGENGLAEPVTRWLLRVSLDSWGALR